MATYFVSLAVGILVGIIYAALQVKSPAPPVIALIGLFGILIGENGLPLIKEKFFSHRGSAVATQKVAEATAQVEKYPHGN